MIITDRNPAPYTKSSPVKWTIFEREDPEVENKPENEYI